MAKRDIMQATYCTGWYWGLNCSVIRYGVMNQECCKYKAHLSRLMTKPTKWHVRPAQTQISLGIRPVRSESSLSGRKIIGSSANHWAHCEDWSDWADGQADLSLRWAHMSFCWFCHEAAHLVLFWFKAYKIDCCDMNSFISHMHLMKKCTHGRYWIFLRNVCYV